MTVTELGLPSSTRVRTAATTASTSARTGRPHRVDRAGVDEGARRDLEHRLRRSVAGDVRFDAGARATWSTDASNYSQVPLGVVCPRDDADVEAVLAACREVGAPVLARGGGTSLAGQSCNVAVVLDFSRHMRGLLDLDPEGRTARVQPGLVLDELRRATEPHGLTFGPDPATHASCTLGGMIGNNSCGTHALLAGKTVDNVEALDVMLFDGTRLRVGATSDEDYARVAAGGGRAGELYRGLRGLADTYADLVRERYPDIPRRVSGYNLDDLLPERGFHVARSLVGTESTCALVLEATVRLAPWPSHRRTVVLGYPDFFVAADAVPQVLEHGPIGLEGFDLRLTQDMRSVGLNLSSLPLLPEGGGWLLVELGDDDPDALEDAARRLVADVTSGAGGPDVRDYADAADQAAVWKVRESGLGATARPKGRLPNHEGWEDAAVDPARVGDYLRDITALWDEFGYSGAWYGHVGQGCVHTRNDFRFDTDEEVAKFRRFMEAAADVAVGHGGSLSGEHGDGQGRGELLEKMFGPELLDAFRQFKTLWDPDGRMNPGKVVDPFPLDSNLRDGPDHAEADLEPLHFAFADDGGSLASASQRCVGVGRCRREQGGTMCPSWKVTHDEQHSTRGRARLLHDVLTGSAEAATDDGWRDEHLRESLDLCLSCKGCKVDCPVSVDMATYKAEFLSHYYAGRLRPVAAYLVGWFHRWARLASLAPAAANAVAGSRLTSRLAPLVGITSERPLPAFAPTTLRRWARRRGLGAARPGATKPVVLFADTFTNHLAPQTGRDAAEVLADAGFDVVVPTSPMCCGRPLYDSGQLGLAVKLWRGVLDGLAEHVRAGTPVVVLEPSCLAAFRDELPGLLPDDPDACALSEQTLSLAELLERDGYAPPQVEPGEEGGRAVVHGHCHQKAVVGMESDLAVLRAAGVEPELLDAGCCGLAGAFGFEAEHYDVSMRIGEHTLLPAVRATEASTPVLTDGFSCATQIRYATDREPQHLAEVLAGALRAERRDGGRRRPERVGEEAATGPADAGSSRGEHPGVGDAGYGWRTTS